MRNACGRLLSLAALAPVVGCGNSEHASLPVDAAPSQADAEIDAPPMLECEAYPVPWTADPASRVTAELELASISASATLTWNDNTGAFSSIFQLNHVLPGCTDGHDVHAEVMAFLTAHPALFQLDPAEWRSQPPYDCQFIPTDLQILDVGRLTLAGHAIAKDTFAYWVKRDSNGVVLTSVTGTYVPPAVAGLGEAMTSCSNLDPAAAEATVRATTLTARVYDLCSPNGNVTYQPQSNDTVAVLPGETWSWSEDTGRVLLTGTRTVRVTVAPANYTARLLSSDARCPVLDPDSDDFTVGFDITLDVHTGEILFVKPGLDCLVC